MTHEDSLSDPGPSAPPNSDEPVEVSPEDFTEGFGEDLSATLDLNTWTAGEDLGQLYSRIDAEVQEATKQEDEVRKWVRANIFPKLALSPIAPRMAGVYQAQIKDLQSIHRGLLFNGGIEGCDGTRQIHDTLPLTIFQIGVSLVSYQGNQGTWGHRLFRRDLRVSGGNPYNEMVELLQRRDKRSGLNQFSRRDALSDLAQRGIMSYAERAILLQRSSATWRMGHGNPAPYELITGSGSLDLMIESTKIIRELVEGHQKFLFVASEPEDRLLLTIGDALRPLEYAIVRSFKEMIEKIVENGHYRMRTTVDTAWDGKQLKADEWIKRFRDRVAPTIVVGVYRATPLASAQVFYAHEEHAHIAAHIALADSILQEHRGFPMLIDLAHNVCSAVFGGDTLSGPVTNAYTQSGEPWRYLSERTTR